MVEIGMAVLVQFVQVVKLGMVASVFAQVEQLGMAQGVWLIWLAKAIKS